MSPIYPLGGAKVNSVGEVNVQDFVDQRQKCRYCNLESDL